MANEFNIPIDIANRALQHLGAKRIDPNLGFLEQSKNASEIAACYDKLRSAELQRNVWRFAIRHAALRPVNAIALGSQPFVVNPTTLGTPIAPTMAVAPALWSSVTTYTVGSLVTDSTGSMWMSTTPSNLGSAPGFTTAWEEYFGPTSADYWNPAEVISYYAGELVYNFVGDGTYTVFQSIMSNNAAPPTVALPWAATQVYADDEVAVVYPAWSSGTTYAAGAAVLYTDGNNYASIIGGNINNPPSTSPSQWAVLPTTGAPTGETVSAITEWSQIIAYTTGTIVDYGGALYVSVAASTGVKPLANPASWAVFSGGTLYQSLVDLNLNNVPASSPTQWSTTLTSGSGSGQWKTINCALQPLGLVYPLGSGPTNQSWSRNVFKLPAGFLRKAPQDPKAGSVSWLGAPQELMYNDWNLEDGYLTSTDTSPILLRFVFNQTQVGKMHPMFCEGLACRIAFETCEAITQSDAKLARLAATYKEFMGEARTVNAIEIGSEEPPLDDFIACRW